MSDSFDENAILYLLDDLDPSARADFEALVARDEESARRLRELERELEARIRALPQQAPPTRAWTRIETAIGGGSARPAVRIFPWNLVRVGLAAALLLGLGVRVLHDGRAVVPEGSDRMVVADLGINGGRVASSPVTAAGDADERFRQLALLARRYAQTPAGADSTAAAYALFDPGASEGFIGVRHLQPPVGGRRYHLWVVDAVTHEVQDAGELPLDGADQGLYHFSVSAGSANRSARVDFVVTAEEGAGPHSRPAGSVVMGSQEPTRPF